MRGARAIVGLPFLLAGCLSVGWERESRYAPVPDGVIARLEEGRTELGECLATFGAPLWVWEHPAAGGDGAALAYGWYVQRDLGFRVSVPVTEQYSGSFDYDQIDSRMRGLVLFFDHDWKLAYWRTGLMSDLVNVQRRPASVEE
jgi:hypothetical protein